MKRIVPLIGAIGVVLLIAGIGLVYISAGIVAYILTGAGGAALIASLVLRILEVARIHEGTRPRKERMSLVLLIVIVLVIVGILNFLGIRHSARFDLTANKKYSLAPQTVKVLQGLETDVTISVFDKKDSPLISKARELLKGYRHYSSKIKDVYIDPDRQPDKAREMGVSEYGTVIVQSGNRTERLKKLEENEITNAIIRVTSERQKRIYFLTGHGEHNINDEEGADGYGLARKELENSNHTVDELMLLAEVDIPDDCDLLVVAGPKRELLTPEREKIKEFLDKGGSLLFMCNPREADSTVAWLENTLGIDIGNDIVVDVSMVGKIFGANEFMPIASEYSKTHPITEEMGNNATVFPLARSVSADTTGFEEIVKTLPRSWGETDIDNEQFKFEPDKDVPGPVPLAIAGTMKSRARVAVFGDSDFASNTYISFMMNKDLFLNTISWLVEEENKIAIRPKQEEDRRITLTRGQSRTIFYISVIALPLVALLVGTVIWWRRR
ncbi:GldG family protein [bacterium]|nr:GldG family protein [bacterium]